MSAQVPVIDCYFIATLTYNKGSGGPPGSVELPSSVRQAYGTTTEYSEHTFTFNLRGITSQYPEYKQIGWSIGGAGYGIEGTYRYTATHQYAANQGSGETISASATWEKRKYATITIIYHYNNTSYSKDYSVSGYIGDTTVINLDPVPALAYYNGRWKNKGGTVISSITAPVTKDTTYDVYANYVKKDRTYQYNGNLSGYTVSNLPDSKTQWCKESYTIPSNKIPTTSKKDGFAKTFWKWNTKADGTGTSYNPGATIDGSNSSTTLTLYALWKCNFIYKPDSNSNETSNACSNVNPGSSLTILSKFTHKPDAAYDYEIDYYTANSTKYYVNQSYTISSDIVATVHWKQTEKKYAVTYNGNAQGVTNLPSTQYKYHSTVLSLSTKIPVYEGHNFLSWNTQANGSGRTYQPGESYSINKPVTLYAQWELQTFHIFYDLNGGNGTLPQTGEVQWNSNYTIDTTLYPNLTKTYHKCVGWNTNKSATSGILTLSNVKKDTTLFAIWNNKKSNIIYRNEGASDIHDGARDQGTKYTTLSSCPSFVKDNCVLFGWATTPNSGARLCALGGEITLPNQGDNTNFVLYPYWRSTFDAYYSEYKTTTRGRRIIYQEDYIKKGGF